VDTGIGVEFGSFRLEHRPRRLLRRNRPVGLQPRPLAVLAYLVEHADRVVPKEELLAEIWAGTIVSQAVLKVAVRAIREALGEDPDHPRHIETVGREGYRFRLADASGGAASPRVAAETSASTSSPGAAGVVVGREVALDQLSAAWRAAQRGERQLVFVAGEPGIGKTTLVEQFARSALRGPVGWGRCVEAYGAGEAYLPILEALGEICRGPQGRATRDVLARHAPIWLSQLGALLTEAELAALGPRLVGASRDRMRRELGDALEALGVLQTVVLVLEDLHVSDQSTVDLLGYLAGRRGRARLLVLGSHRPAELVARQHPLRGLIADLKAHQRCTELRLEALTLADVRRYVAARLGTTAIPEGLAEGLHARTEGLPLFLANVMDDLIGQQIVTEAGGQWRLAREPESWPTPDTLRDLISHRLDGLAAEELTVLEAASVAGVEWNVASVARALDLGLNRVEDLCEALATRSGLVREQGLAERPDGSVTGSHVFRHALHRSALYQRLPESRRARLHRAIGRSDEAGYGARSRDIAPALALHFEEGRDLDRAARYRREAADLALERYAYREALAHAQKGAELVSCRPESSDRARQLLDLAFLSIRA
jgi:DNA-binding winged helix-turn-helix (wHTH) protein